MADVSRKPNKAATAEIEPAPTALELARRKMPPPEQLDDEALYEWKRVTLELETVGRLEATDRALLVLYVDTWSMYQKAQEILRADGLTKKHTNDIVGRTTAYNIARECARDLRFIIGDLGLSPMNRGKVKPNATGSGPQAGRGKSDGLPDW